MKKPFILKALNTAVLSTLGLAGLTTEANAVQINPHGLGQALVYPYDTVRND